MSAAVPKVLAAIHAVLTDMSADGISKARKNDQQGYKFRGIDDVFNALSGSLSRNKLIILPRVTKREVVERESAKGNALFYVVCDITYTFYSVEDGSSVEAMLVGEAMDSADKATNKAMSAAYKYMALQSFAIPTEGDNDADATTHDVRKAPEKRSALVGDGNLQPAPQGTVESAALRMLRTEVEKHGTHTATVTKKIVVAMGLTDTASLGDIPEADLAEALTKLLDFNKRLKAANEAKKLAEGQPTSGGPTGGGGPTGATGKPGTGGTRKKAANDDLPV